MNTDQSRPETTAEKDVVELLLRQHALIRDLFDEVERATGTARAESFQRLVRMLAVHETAEEEIVHPYARRAGDGVQGLVDERLTEEREAKALLSRMEMAGVEDPNFATDLGLLRTAVLAHARAEERYEFNRLQAETSQAERRAMAAAVKAAEAMAPTHPHMMRCSCTMGMALVAGFFTSAEEPFCSSVAPLARVAGGRRCARPSAYWGAARWTGCARSAPVHPAGSPPPRPGQVAIVGPSTGPSLRRCADVATGRWWKPREPGRR